MIDDPSDPDSTRGADPASDFSSRDDAALLELLLGSPDRIDPRIVLWADGRVLPKSDPGRRTVVGWHRGGGPVLLSVTTGVATDGALLEAFHLAAIEGEAPVERWEDPLETFWDGADPGLRDRIAGTWGHRGRIASPRAWTELAWGAPPVSGPARTGVVAARVPGALRRTIAWLADLGVEVAAWEIARSSAPGDAGFGFERVAGRWSDPPERPLPAMDEERRRRTYVRHTGGITAALLSELETTCRSSGAAVAWSGEEWVRFDGPGRSLRVFPGMEWIDLQFVGADEGTLIGLRFRYGVSVGGDAPSGAPPGVHLRLSSPEDLGPEVRLLVRAWLGGRPQETGRPPGRVSRGRRSSKEGSRGDVGDRDRPSGRGRERGRRNR